MVVMGEDVIYGGLNGGGGGEVVRFRKGFSIVLWKISDSGKEEIGGVDSFGIGST